MWERSSTATAYQSVRPLATADQSVWTPTATGLLASGPVLQWRFEYATAAPAATDLHGASPNGSERAVAEERRVGDATMQLRFHAVHDDGRCRDADVPIQSVDGFPGTVRVISAHSLCSTASDKQRCMAVRPSSWGRHSYLAVQFWLRSQSMSDKRSVRSISLRWNPGV